jgi:isoleucyl-tRNA synthetase
VDAFTRLLAPILCFTADEIWEALPGTREASVHLAEFPDGAAHAGDEELLKRWDEREMGILFVRSEVQRALEQKRNEKVIGASLEASVKLAVGRDQYKLLKRCEDQLPAIFIVSQVELLEGAKDEIEIKVEHAGGAKCERCWNWSETVGLDPRVPQVDARCIRQLEQGWGL